MLARNEEMETQATNTQQEYEELKRKLEGVVDLDYESLREKYDEALEIIEQLKNGESIHRSQSNDDSVEKQSKVDRLEEENIELREVVNHIVSSFACTIPFTCSSKSDHKLTDALLFYLLVID